jgi:SepF-like predicted cell division protein (DUF552 family)
MKETLHKITSHFKRSFGSEPEPDDDYEEEYVELDSKTDETKAKINVRPFNLDDFSDIKPILDCLREGYTVALINIKPLKDKDLVELKRAINKLKKTCQALEGDVAGFGEDWIVAVPSFAEIYRNQQTTKIETD